MTTTFVVEYRSPSIRWERNDLLSLKTGETLQEMKTSYTTLPIDIQADDLEDAKAQAEALFPNMVRKVYEKNLDKTIV